MTEMMTTATTIDRPPVAAEEITADVICETAERLGIMLVRGHLYFNRRLGCGCALGVAVIVQEPGRYLDEAIPIEVIGAAEEDDFLWGLEHGFEGWEPEEWQRSHDFLRGYAVGREVACRAGLGD